MLITIDSNVDNMAELIADKLLSSAKLWCTAVNKCPLNAATATQEPMEIDNEGVVNSTKTNAKPNTNYNDNDNNDEPPSRTCSLQVAKQQQQQQQRQKLSKNVEKQTTKASKSNEKTQNKRNIFYNTPISLADEISPYNFDQEPDGQFFIYLDASRQELSYNRIMKNLKSIPNAILICNKNVKTETLPYQAAYIIDVGNCGSSDVSDLLSAIISIHILVGRRVPQQELIIMCYPSSNLKSNESSNTRALTNNAAMSQPKTVNGSTYYNIYSILDAKSPKPLEVDDCHECM